MSAAARSLLGLGVVLALLASVVLAPLATPAALPAAASEFGVAPSLELQPAVPAVLAGHLPRVIVTEAAPTARSATPPVLSIRGSLAGPAPGYGQAWIVEAYRLTSTRNSVVEQRRSFVDAFGAFAFEALVPGVWQVALVAPTFAWGPIVDLTRASCVEDVRLPVSGTGRLHLDLVAGALAQRGARVRLELFALRGTQPSECLAAPLRLMRCVLQRELRVGERCTIDDLAPGIWEVQARVVDATVDGAAYPVARAEVTMAASDVRIDVRLPAVAPASAAAALSDKPATPALDSVARDARRRENMVRNN